MIIPFHAKNKDFVNRHLYVLALRRFFLPRAYQKLTAFRGIRNANLAGQNISVFCHKLSVEGKKALVIGRSSSVGRPLAQLLLNNNATVTIAHSRTKNLKELAQKNEIVCVAIGRREMIDESYLNSNQIIIDVGIHYNEEGKLVGDVKESAKQMVKYASLVPGGVGPLTNYKLLENLIKSYEMRNS